LLSCSSKLVIEASVSCSCGYWEVHPLACALKPGRGGVAL
jgi:hypothetical protein